MKYSIEQVVKKTGVSAFSLRNWEKRYQFLHPKRLNNGFRYYDETDVALLKRVRELMEEGARIGDLAERIRKGEALPEPQANQRRDEATRGTEELFDFLKEGEVQKAIASWEKLQAWVPVTRQVEWVLASLYLRACAERDAGTLSMFEFQSVLSYVRAHLSSLILAPLAEPHHFKEGHRKTALFSVLRTPEQTSSELHQRAETALAFRAWKARERGRAVHFVEGGVSPADVRSFLDRHEGVEAYLTAEPRFRGLLNGYGRSIHWVSARVDRLELLLGMDTDGVTGVTAAPLIGAQPGAAAREEEPDTMAG
jgi:DNA-binding transcriptional MerR regulator